MAPFLSAMAINPLRVERAAALAADGPIPRDGTEGLALTERNKRGTVKNVLAGAAVGAGALYLGNKAVKAFKNRNNAKNPNTGTSQ